MYPPFFSLQTLAATLSQTPPMPPFKLMASFSLIVIVTYIYVYVQIFVDKTCWVRFCLCVYGFKADLYVLDNL